MSRNWLWWLVISSGRSRIFRRLGALSIVALNFVYPGGTPSSVLVLLGYPLVLSGGVPPIPVWGFVWSCPGHPLVLTGGYPLPTAQTWTSRYPPPQDQRYPLVDRETENTIKSCMTARGVPPAAYPVHGVSCLGEGVVSYPNVKATIYKAVMATFPALDSKAPTSQYLMYPSGNKWHTRLATLCLVFVTPRQVVPPILVLSIGVPLSLSCLEWGTPYTVPFWVPPGKGLGYPLPLWNDRQVWKHNLLSYYVMSIFPCAVSATIT